MGNPRIYVVHNISVKEPGRDWKRWYEGYETIRDDEQQKVKCDKQPPYARQQGVV